MSTKEKASGSVAEGSGPRTVAIIGGGKMGAALAGGLIASAAGLRGSAPSSLNVVIVESDSNRRAELAKELPNAIVVTTTSDLANVIEAGATKAAVLAVKPADSRNACVSLKDQGFSLVLSIMAGVTIAEIERHVGPNVPVVRSMPNTPALIGAGAAAIAGGESAAEAALQWAEEILGSVGIVVRLPEKSLDAVTGLSGSGPAYVFLIAEALTDAGVLAGLPRSISAKLAAQTLYGSARLLVESGDEPERLRAQVTSPGGTTAAGLRVLESSSVRSAFLEAVMAAAERSRELGS